MISSKPVSGQLPSSRPTARKLGMLVRSRFLIANPRNVIVGDRFSDRAMRRSYSMRRFLSVNRPLSTIPHEHT